ncbi:MAG: hypothetical protein NC305_13420 [Lachnospiraceae bacterium]|nr:hypothetical protein [Butyrivibrio sp.]MCM1344002.1 hypothetical protein [Muribaculaceae bacterium]MCM1411531.1 hypothetical protein [Lachnospiraceae bacterium]
MIELQFLQDLIGNPVYELSGQAEYRHVAEGFMVDPTGVYILLQDDRILNIHNAYLKGGNGKLFPASVMGT